MESKISAINKNTFWELLFEWCLIVLPVFLFVLIESLHKKSVSFFFYSPEWSIATCFLVIQGVRLYRKGIEIKDRNDGFVDFFTFVPIIVFLPLAVFNAYFDLGTKSDFFSVSFLIRTILFFSASLYFFVFAGVGLKRQHFL